MLINYILWLSYLLSWVIKSARWSQSACQPENPFINLLIHLLTYSDGASGARVLFTTSEFAQVEIQMYRLVLDVGWEVYFREVPRCPQRWWGNSCHAVLRNAVRWCFELGQPKLPKAALCSDVFEVALIWPSWTELAFGNDWADRTSWPWWRWSCWWALDPS